MEQAQASMVALAPVPIELTDEIQAIQRDNVLTSLDRIADGDVKAFEPREMPRHLRHYPLHIVGGGESAAVTVNNATWPICAINGAHDWLIENYGRAPEFALLLDWHNIVFERLTPHSDVTYWLGSQSHPSAYEVLKGHDVHVFHGAHAAPCLPAGTKVYGGGPNAVQRVIPVAYEWGFREFHFHGVDACFGSSGRHHVYDWPDQKESSGTYRMRVRYVGREFETRMDWVRQAQTFEQFLPIYQKWQDDGILEPIKIVVHGDGLIPHIARIHGIHALSIPTEPGGAHVRNR